MTGPATARPRGGRRRRALADATGTGASARRHAKRAASAAIPAAAAPASRPLRGPATSASQPTAGAPIGVEPRKTTEYSAITRPRIAGSTASWSEELTPAAKVTLAAPSGSSASTCSGRVGASATSSSASANAVAAATRRRGDTRPRALAASAPDTEPTPMAAVSIA